MNIKKVFLPRKNKWIVCVGWGILLIILFFLCWPHKNFTRRKLPPADKSEPLLLWWKPMLGLGDEYISTRFCGINKCTFTSQRAHWKESTSLLFYGSEFKVTDIPLPRSSKHIWALLHEESPRNVPFMPHTSFLKHFNFTSTFSRYSDYPLTTLYLEDAADLTSPKYLIPVGEKTRLQQKENLAPILFMQTDCDTPSERDTYVKELMQYVNVDSYGACLHNRDLPASLATDYLNKLNSPELYRFISRYKFILSYENGVCYDYITEKFWRPLVVGSIPVYFGSPTIKDWQPNAKSVIHISDFPSPKTLAGYILSINANDTEYNTFLHHKYNQVQPIGNKHLQQELLLREYSPAVNPNVMGLFECFVCDQMYKQAIGNHQTATSSHYDCPFPPAYPPMSSERSTTYETWRSIMSVGKCQAELIDELLQRNNPFSGEQYHEMLNKKAVGGACN